MTRTTRAAGLAAVLLLGVRSYGQTEADPGPGGPAGRLIGAYTIVQGEKDGRLEPDDRVRGTTVRITADRIIVTDKDTKETYAATYKVDTGKKPWAITMTSTLPPSKGEAARGLIEKNGDTVRLIYAVRGGQDPTAFKTREKQLMFTMKAMKK
jgi:uncharacterized protein (TIGR03067 family)